MDALIWVVVIIILVVGQFVTAAVDIENLHARNLQAQVLSGLATDTQALLSFKQKIVIDPNGVLNQWNLQFSSNSCDWFGITCANAHVIALNLDGCGLVAPLALATLAPLDHLQEIRLANNSFYSSGSDQIDLSSAGCNTLTTLNLSSNNLTGTISTDIGNCLLALQELDLSANDLVGTIPSSLSNCTSLHLLNLGDNAFSGVFPVAVINRMQSLHTLILSYNYFTGMLPSSLANASSLSVLDLSANSFTSGIPSTICGPSLRRLLLADNELSGAVPLGNCTNLVAIDVSCNFINSTFPKPFPVLPYLQDFVMWANLIEEEIPSNICTAAGQLRLLVLNLNLINGTIPPTLANCSKLEWLSLSANLLTGSIPTELGLMPRINYLHLNNNSLSGTIPPSLGDCKFLVWVDFSSNLLEGRIPPELAKQSGKVIKGTLDQSLHLAFFKYLQGDPCTRSGLGLVLMMVGVRPERVYRIPSFGSCNRTRLYLDIMPYYFPGPPGSSQGGSYTYLDLAHNKLSGPIPEELGTMTFLTVLSLSYNNLTGSIPFSLANFIRCSILHLDHNHLQGPIPPGLSSLGILNQLDLSNNNLSGSIPGSGKLPTFPESSFANNPYLCGMPLPDCVTQQDSISNVDSPQGSVFARMESLDVRSNTDIIMIVVIPVAAVLLIMLGLLRIRHHCTKEQLSGEGEENSGANGCSAETPLSINMATFEKDLRKLTYQQLWDATNGFSEKAIIGQGGFGFVYKAIIADGTMVAIKKLIAHPLNQGNRGFIAEMETIGKIKHRNLVPLIGYCQKGEEKLLVYEYMEGGSLYDWLHGSMEQQGMHDPCTSTQMVLSWDRRKRVALGIGTGLCFLHNDCIPHIIHRDLKSANVLLDDTFEARVSDFGMARLLSASESHTSVSTLAGTAGYVPPEYCQSFQCTKQGDVYSYGVVLLELITGRHPISSVSPTNTEGNDNNAASRRVAGQHEEGLVEWVKRHMIEGNATAILDKRALHGGNSTMATSDIESREEEMLAYLGIAYKCIDERPKNRPSMRDVMARFKAIHHGQDIHLLQ